MSEQHKEIKFRHILSGKTVKASEMGKALYEEEWQQQKDDGEIPESRSDFSAPHQLEFEEYPKIGLSFLRPSGQEDEGIEWEEIKEG